MADATVLRKIYQVSTRLSFAGLIVVILLVLHKSPAPAVAIDPAAAKRVEQKFAAADQAKAAGQPAQVQMDGTELNSYLAQNLQLAGSAPATAVHRCRCGNAGCDYCEHFGFGCAWE